MAWFPEAQAEGATPDPSGGLGLGKGHDYQIQLRCLNPLSHTQH